MPTALIVGASRGLGGALAEEFARRDWEVVATIREAADAPNEAIEHETLDITDVAGVDRLGHALAGRTLDLLFVNAGVSGTIATPIGDVPTEEFAQVMVTNALAPLRLIDRLIDKVAADGTIGVMTSDLGSISRSVAGRAWEAYRMSKAALNMGLCNLAHRHGADARTFLAVAPGWVRTEMGGAHAPLSIDQSIAGVADTIEARRGTGGTTFVNYLNQEVPW